MAGLCTNNLTIGFPIRNWAIRDGKNKITGGAWVTIWDKFLVHKNKRECTYYDEYVTKIENTTNYDVYAVPDHSLNMANYFARKLNLEASKTTSSESQTSFQFLDYKLNRFYPLDILLFFLIDNIYLLAIILIGYLIVILMALIILKMIHSRFNQINSIILNEKRLIQLSPRLIFVFASLNFFLFFTLNYLINTIKTDTIVVDQSQFIDSIEKLNNTNKILVVQNQKAVIEFFRILKKKETKRVIKIFDYFNWIHALEGMTRYHRLNELFFFGDRAWINFFAYQFSILGKMKDHIVFSKGIRFIEYIKILTIRKNLDQKKKNFINKRIDNSFEHGLWKKLELESEEIYISLIMKEGIKIYDNTDDYSKDFLPNTQVGMINFQKTFLVFFLILFSILIVFLLHHLILFLKEKSF